MNEQDPKPGVVIDVEPEQRGGGQAEYPPVGGPARLSRVPVLLAGLALLAVLGGGALAYWHSLQLDADLAAMDARLQTAVEQQRQMQQSLGSATQALQAQQDALREQREVLAGQRAAFDQARGAFREQEQRLAEENRLLGEREAELRAAVADVYRRVGRSGTQWLIAETEYLLRIANERIILARDSGTAKIALQLADQRLRSSGDPGWAGVREQIARDIARLGAFEAPDIAGLSARLAALLEQIPQLEIAHATLGPERTLPEPAPRDPQQRSWDTLLDDLWGGFKNAVRIRERDQPVQAMLGPEQRFLLHENLKRYLQAAHLGVARIDPALFRQNLAAAADWLDRHFVADDPLARSLGQAIAELRAIDIRPELPDISESLRALQLRQKLMQDVASSAAATE